MRTRIAIVIGSVFLCYLSDVSCTVFMGWKSQMWGWPPPWSECTLTRRIASLGTEQSRGELPTGSAPAVPQQALDCTQGLSKLHSQASYNIRSKVIFSVLWKSVLVLSDACKFHTFLQKISSCFQISWSYASQQKQWFELVKTEAIEPTLYNL